jgi:hypothetical protein
MSSPIYRSKIPHIWEDGPNQLAQLLRSIVFLKFVKTVKKEIKFLRRKVKLWSEWGAKEKKEIVPEHPL